MMIERIKKNEKRLDEITDVIKMLDFYLNEFEKKEKDIQKLNHYYGSKNWFKDKEKFEKKEINNLKAGVLSEDAVWNLNEEINDLYKKMGDISKNSL